MFTLLAAVYFQAKTTNLCPFTIACLNVYNNICLVVVIHLRLNNPEYVPTEISLRAEQKFIIAKMRRARKRVAFGVCMGTGARCFHGRHSHVGDHKDKLAGVLR